MDVAALASPQDNGIRPVPVVHSANGGQINLAAAGYRRYQQNVQEVCYQQESLPSVASTEYQHSKPGGHVFTTLQSSHHKMSRMPNAYANLLAHIPERHGGCFGDENSVRQIASSKQCFSEHSLTRSNLNSITGLKQGQHINTASSGSTSSAALQGDSPAVSAETSPLQDQCSSVPVRKLHKYCPLVRGTLAGSAPAFKSCMGSNVGYYKSQPVKSSQTSLNCGQTRAQSLDDSGGPLSNPSQQKVHSSPLIRQSSTDKVLAVGGGEPPTDAEILDYVKKQVAYFKSLLNAMSNPKSNSVARLPTTSDKEDLERHSLSCPVSEQCTNAGGQALEEDGVKNSKGHYELKSKGRGDMCASEKHSTEYPQIMLEVAATCTKGEEESPVVLTAVLSSQEKSLWVNADKNLDGCEKLPGVPWALKDTTHRPVSLFSLTPAKLVELDSVQGMTDIFKDSWTSRPFGTHHANSNKPKNIEDQQHSHVTCKEVAVQSKLNASIHKIPIHNAASATTNQNEQPVSKQTSHKSMREVTVYMYSEAYSSTACSENKDKEVIPLSGSEGEQTVTGIILKDSQYEDISDSEDMSQLDTTIPNTEHEKLRFSARFEDSPYEDISEDENPEVSQTNMKQHGHVQAQMKSILAEVIPETAVSPKRLDVLQHCCCPFFVENDNGFERVLCPKCDSDRHQACQTNLSCSPSAVLKDEDETDDQMDDDWFVIPLSISDVKFEPLDENEADPEKVLLNDGGTSITLDERALNPVPASAFSQMEVFGTFNGLRECFDVALGSGIPERTPHTPQNRRDSNSEAGDSSETEDSYYYSSDPEHNYLTVSRKLLKNLSALSPTHDSESESESEGEDKATNLQKTSTKPDETVLDGDTEDEGNQKCTEQMKRRKRLSSSPSEDCGGPPRSQQKRHSPETVDSWCGTAKKNGHLPFVDTPAPQRHSRFHEEVMQDACSHLSDRTEKCEQQLESKTKSEPVPHEITRRKSSDDKTVIILDSDTEDGGDQTYRKKKKSVISLHGGAASRVKRKRKSETVDREWKPAKEKLQAPKLSSAVKYRKKKSVFPPHAGAASRVKRKRKSETVDREWKPAKEKLQAPKLSSAVSSKPKHRSKPQDKPLIEEMLDERPNLAHSTKSRQLTEAKVGSVPQKTNRQTTILSELDRLMRSVIKKKRKRRVRSSETEDSDDASVAAQNNIGVSRKPEVAGSSFGSNPVIPRLVVQMPSQPSGHLKLCRQGNDKTPTATSKNTPSEKKRHMYRDENGQFSKLKRVNSTHRATQQPKSKEHSPGPSRRLSLSKLQRPRSFSDPSTSDHRYAPTSSSSTTMQSSATTQATTGSQNSFAPTRKDRKSSRRMEEDLNKNIFDSLRKAKPAPSHNDRASRRRRRSSHESTTRLMKRTKLEAMQLTRARNQDPTKEQRFPVSGGYKWKTPAGTM